ncbi:hypothetical protein GP486_002899 [Trichoglossum hirsutum]|uniref:Uncharacterized protein n=1 Tax=Trichoglossum hirsutum TaxID=265104 RepID=A0A9P8RR89_9PEZI|nr:hypothetical protein GP486_002899 [Trichoglossum hirsutum]
MPGEPDPVKAVVLPFLQHWDASSKELSLRILIVPRDSFIVPFVPNDLESKAFFPNAELKFNVRISTSFSSGLPILGRGTAVQSITLTPESAFISVFKSLVETFGNIINSSPQRARPQDDVNELQPKSVRKHLPASYRQATCYTPDGRSMFTTGNEYSCAMKQVRPKPYKKPYPVAFKPSWGELIASILRIPDFATTAGFIRARTIPIAPEILVEGGYLWLELDHETAATIGVSDASPLKTFAARIPPLEKSADLFTPLLFPVLSDDNPSHLPPVPGNSYDQMFREAEDYADGWAKAVHCVQPQSMAFISEKPSSARPAKDLGIRIGWDDEQVTIWADRQLNPDPLKAGYDQFPLGIHGYRVDVRESIASGEWISLNNAKGEFGVGTTSFGHITSELGVAVHPSTPMDVVEDRSYWMPMYFTNWTQASLVGNNEIAMKLLGRYKPPNNAPPPPFPQTGYVDPAMQLRYGRNYEFRVRLMDHTGGGLTLQSATGHLGHSPIARIPFRRWIKPLTPQLVSNVPILKNEPGSETMVDFIEVKRPVMFYPGVVFAGYTYNGRDALTELLAMADSVAAAPPADTDRVIEPGLPDPDVDRIEITVLVQTLTQDSLAKEGSFMELYTTTRSLPVDLKDSAKIPLKWVDCADVWNPPEETWTTSTTSLRLPRARTIKLRIGALCREETGSENVYFGAKDVQRGPQIVVTLRRNGVEEPKLFDDNNPSYTINGFFLQPSSDATSQFAAALGLRSKDGSLRASPGKRVVFACGSTIMHVLGPDRASLTFASQASLASQWIVAIRLTMERDWSWDGFSVDGIRVSRDGQEVAVFGPGHNANEDAFAGSAPERSSTYIVVFDVIDPKPMPRNKPEEMHLEYTVETKYLGAIETSQSTMSLSIDLPITTPPAQIPKIASAGVAMTPYIHDEGYSNTAVRTKMLWLEFASPLEDPQDRYFCRVLKYAPDPLLLGTQYQSFSTEESQEPPIPLDPEPLRRIVPRQTFDTAGLDAMQPLVATSSPLHWGVPLPPGLTPDSLELLGFWTYELRVGHWHDEKHPRWSTAQGRFGPPLRVTGVQHPMPELPCSLSVDHTSVRVSSQFAQPVQDGRPLVPKQPNTSVWFLLYAQAAQIDGSGEKRNLLIARVDAQAVRVSGSSELQPRAVFQRAVINDMLKSYGLKLNTPLSAMAVELYDQKDHVSDPLGGDLGRQRILRSSCLVAVPSMC